MKAASPTRTAFLGKATAQVSALARFRGLAFLSIIAVTRRFQTGNGPDGTDFSCVAGRTSPTLRGCGSGASGAVLGLRGPEESPEALAQVRRRRRPAVGRPFGKGRAADQDARVLPVPESLAALEHGLAHAEGASPGAGVAGSFQPLFDGAVVHGQALGVGGRRRR